MERCGKINASNSGAESWTGIGVVAGCGAVVLIMQWPSVRNGEVNWGSALLQRLQEVRRICKTRNQLRLRYAPSSTNPVSLATRFNPFKPSGNKTISASLTGATGRGTNT